MGKSYGFIEITGVVAAINALDIMCKTADVELASWERKLGGRLVTLIVQGDVVSSYSSCQCSSGAGNQKTCQLCGNCQSSRGNRQTG